MTYIFEADETEDLQVAEEENTAVQWINITELDKFVTEEHMKPVYTRLIEKMKKI